MDLYIDVNIEEKELKNLTTKAKDWAISHGLLMKPKKLEISDDEVQLVPLMLLPTQFSKSEFEKAVNIQTSFNELMHKVAYDFNFLKKTLENTIKVDEFTANLFEIHEKVHSEGVSQDLSLGLIRSDYMLHMLEDSKLKQIEINLISTSFGGLASTVSEYHKYILTELDCIDKFKNIPKNNVLLGFSQGLLEAWKLYNNKKAVILVIVEDIVYNLYDQKSLEFKIKELSPETKIIRKTLTELITEAHLGPNKELIVNNLEVALVYYRSGYQVEAYPTKREWDVRLLIERSQAIKCPSIQYQLAGTKKVQQELAMPGVLEKFIKDREKLRKIRDVFVGLYPLDLTKNTDIILKKALENPEKYVLKPQREGGGYNFYNDGLKQKIEEIKNTEELLAFILMDRIYPPVQKNYVIRSGLDIIRSENFVSELGIYGFIIGNSKEIITNKQNGHIIRSKLSTANEGGIVVGAGALDGPYLV